MRTYIFTVEDHSTARGYNQTIRVYRMKRNVPHFVGYNDKINTASTYGEYAVARQIVRDAGLEKMKDSYHFASDNIRLIPV